MQEKPPSGKGEKSAVRRQPAQQRSRERLDRILEVAQQLIAEKGSEHVRMSEIAELAEISIGSLYQYFPDKRAIVRTLAGLYAAESRRCVREALEAVQNRAQLLDAFASLVDQYYEIVLDKPVMRDISSALRSDKELTSIEIAESKACGALLAAAIRRVTPGADSKRVNALAFLIWQMGEETMRLAVAHKRGEGALLVDAYKRMSLRAIEEA
ncbi:TetR family transcriptional regulator (plasmid) [Burkholderia sp. SFA1]|uniref:TetR/AcrR family transcriptional regulator n=1 Tax=unclassified Caballeronia TaxID=2646786 RepID=UPI001F3C0177|nr:MULTISPECIES: TetR family transcriptional regulator [unclassified Caballeronia]MCE4546810.1 TetR/AcrR family transcriptional regulator [Caballeronia sp. PC1]MCE4572717.1 TetR/AcrR family transcriptional regulator [Caballeronia sp. CLC5]BBQ01909.1 TetR family transcriptional regulator [Burkholderia sp. SFA1]